MEFIKEWITNIILFILLATVLDMLLPNSSMQKYTKMITGLLLIAIILTPVFKIISKDFEAAFASIPNFEKTSDKEMENLIEMNKKEIQASQEAYILETMAVQLEKDADKELMEQYGLQITKIELSINENTKSAFPDNLEKVIVSVKEPDKKAEAIKAVETVKINTGQPLPSKQAINQEIIAAFLSQKWNMKESTIEVVMAEGGNTEKNG